MIKHIVVWRLKEGINKGEILNELKTKLEDLPEKIDSIHHLEAGINFSKSPMASEIVLYSEFKSKKDLTTYRKHPAHQEVVKYLKARVSETRVVDYKI